jgi:hypothetical protein
MDFGAKKPELLWGGIIGCLVGLAFIAYGMKRTPHEFSYLNPWKKPLSVRTARLIYFPTGLVVIILSLRDIINAF